MLKSFCGVIGLGVLLSCSPTWATIWDLDTNMDGLQEVPPNVSPAFGSGDFTLNDVTNVFTVTTGSYQDLLGNATVVTLNDAGPGVNGPVIASLTLDSPGTMTGTFSGSGTLTAVQTADVLNGNGYVNIRSNVFPSGEIRGQISSVPEPASLSLLACGGLLALGRKRHV
jgi:CHRD domain